MLARGVTCMSLRIAKRKRRDHPENNFMFIAISFWVIVESAFH